MKHDTRLPKGWAHASCGGYRSVRKVHVHSVNGKQEIIKEYAYGQHKARPECVHSVRPTLAHAIRAAWAFDRLVPPPHVTMVLHKLQEKKKK